MSEKIQNEHLGRLAIVYVRQSSPGQVKNHRESYRVQTGLTRRARALGWSTERIKVIDGDQGVSASQPQSREDFNTLLEMVKDKQVGIVFGLDVARLARNSIDWSWLTHWCALHGVLLGDQNQVYDPALSQDSLVLGIQGVLAVHELHAIRHRLEAGLTEKASRGELYLGVRLRGYVVVEGIHLRKHPDRRVQTAIERVFKKFETCTSVNQLVGWLWDHNHQLPKARLPGDGTQVEWVDANYKHVLDMLKNPKYAGMYVYPRHQQEPKVMACGKVQKKWRLSRPDEWTVVIKDHHPGYLTAAQYEANQEKIAMNAQRRATARSAPNKGTSLLAGLVECRRCGHKMQVSYSRAGHASYACRNGRRQRDQDDGQAKRGCFRFSADELERQLSEQVLYAVSPAGVRGAELAMERLSRARQERRATLNDRLEQSRYESDLVRRRFDRVDPANRLVFDTLAQELEVGLQAVAESEAALEQFDRDDPPRPTVEEQAQLLELGSRLEDVWYSPQVDSRLKQQVVRLLIEHATVDINDSGDKVVLWLKWSTGHHTKLCSARRRRRLGRSRDEIRSLIETLRKIADDLTISRTLNRVGLRTPENTSWTQQHVSQFRKRERIEAFSQTTKEREGWLTQAEAATYLSISPMSVNRLIQQEVILAEGEPQFPQVIQRTSLASEAVQAAVHRIKTHGNSPLPENPQQQTLFFKD